MKSRLFSRDLETRPSSRPVILAAPEEAELEVLSDKGGSVAFGWAAPSVLYTRFQGCVTAQTGNAYAARLSELVAQARLFCFFCDTSDLKHYDLLARSAFARVILSTRRKFSSLVILTWSKGISPSTRALVATLGEPIEVMTDADGFGARLVNMAPLAMLKLNPKTWVTIAQPPARAH